MISILLLVLVNGVRFTCAMNQSAAGRRGGQDHRHLRVKGLQTDEVTSCQFFLFFVFVFVFVFSPCFLRASDLLKWQNNRHDDSGHSPGRRRRRRRLLLCRLDLTQRKGKVLYLSVCKLYYYHRHSQSTVLKKLLLWLLLCRFALTRRKEEVL